MKTLLKDSSWKVFFKMVILPVLIFVLSIVLSGITGSHFWAQIGPLLAALIAVLVYFRWIWICGSSVLKLIPKSNLVFFRLILLVAIVLLFLIIPAGKALTQGKETVLLIALKSISLSCFLIALYQFASALNDAEAGFFRKTNTVFYDIILIWILPVGIWILHRRVQNVLARSANKDTTEKPMEHQ